MKSFLAKKDTVQRKWHVVDADGVVLGRLAVKVAMTLMGKDKPTYTPHVDTGDFVIVVNADKIKLTGNKAETKTYQTYSGYPGGQKVIRRRASPGGGDEPRAGGGDGRQTDAAQEHAGRPHVQKA